MQLKKYVSTTRKGYQSFWLWYQGALISVKNCHMNVYTVLNNNANWSALTKQYTMVILTGIERYECWLNAIHALWRCKEGHKVAIIAAETKFECERGDHTALVTTHLLNENTNRRFEDIYTYNLNFLFVSGYKSLEDTIYQEKLPQWFKWFGQQKPKIIVVPDHLEIAHQLQQYCLKHNISYIVAYTGGFIQNGKYYYNRELEDICNMGS